MNRLIYPRLSLMMFLQFFVWGAWFVTLGSYLAAIGFSGSQIGTSYMMNNIGAIIAPFLIGVIADKFFQSEHVMAFLHVVGGLTLYYVSGLQDPGLIIVGLLFYNSCYMPTLALVNAIAFNQMADPKQQFPKVRVWGTIGWIVAGLTITFILGPRFADVEATAIPMKLAAVTSVLLGIYSLTLPRTPPGNVGTGTRLSDILGLKALSLLKDRSFAIFVISSMLISIPLAFYYSFANLYLNEAGMEGAAAKMTLGQASEVLFMLIMPLAFMRFGVKWMLLIGMLAWVVRYALFALGNGDELVWMLYGGIILHGICYDFFFVTGQIYVDRKAGPDIRASAQGFIALVTYGVGMAVGSLTAGIIVDYQTRDGVIDWASVWWIPCLFAAAVAAIFLIGFRDTSADEALEIAG